MSLARSHRGAPQVRANRSRATALAAALIVAAVASDCRSRDDGGSRVADRAASNQRAADPGTLDTGAPDTGGANVLARADGSALTVEQAAALLARNRTVRADTAVVRALANLWIDYRLLARAVSDDSAVNAVDLEALAAPEREEALALKVRDATVPPAPELAEPDGAAERRRERRDGPSAGFAEERHHEELRRRRVLAQIDREQAYIADMERTAKLTVLPGAMAALRVLAAHPDARPGGPGGDTVAVATYVDGRVTSGDLRAFLRLQPPATLATLARADSAQSDAVVRQLARKQLLLAQARARGLTLSASDTAALRARVRAEVRARVAHAGFTPIAGTHPTPAVIDSSVRALLAAAIERRTTAEPLDALGARLRVAHPTAVDARAFVPVVARLQALRASAAARPG